MEAIPHITYWEQLPGLVRDGVQFSYVHGKAFAELALERGTVLYTLARERYSSHMSSGHTPVPSTA